MSEVMKFPSTVDEFMEQYKIVDTEKVYTNGAALIPIFRMKQWFEYQQSIENLRRELELKKLKLEQENKITDQDLDLNISGLSAYRSI